MGKYLIADRSYRNMFRCVTVLALAGRLVGSRDRVMQPRHMHTDLQECKSIGDYYEYMLAADKRFEFVLEVSLVIVGSILVVVLANYLGRIAKPRPPSYWKYRPKHCFNDKFYAEVDVSTELRSTMQGLIDATTRKDYMGRGRDGAWATHKGFKVTRVTRIENGKLWTQYSQARSKIRPVAKKLSQVSAPLRACAQAALKTIQGVHEQREKDCPQMKQFVSSLGLDEARNERLLFHASPGVGARNADGDVLFDQEEFSPLHAIKTTGFDERLGSVKGMYGSGIYFADMASKADQYGGRYNPPGSPNGSVGERAAMFVSRVTLGCPYQTDQSLEQLRRPPCVEGHFDLALFFNDEVQIGKPWRRKGVSFLVSANERFDSVMADLTIDGQTKLYREFVVYEQQAYPEYCIYYERTP